MVCNVVKSDGERNGNGSQITRRRILSYKHCGRSFVCGTERCLTVLILKLRRQFVFYVIWMSMLEMTRRLRSFEYATLKELKANYLPMSLHVEMVNRLVWCLNAQGNFLTGDLMKLMSSFGVESEMVDSRYVSL
ncbi:hypothetical protein V6N12_003708 [Hibiscus sabdariffa]|uniref:Uncharacterized protein n=1 Tax=Hibiscus sabdariffa TaxID=183260 RepID=A0ABR1ZQ04_9ROSI